MVENNVSEYIRQASVQGMSQEEIKQELLKAGWDQSRIDEGFKKPSPAGNVSLGLIDRVRNYSIKSLSIAAVIAVLLCALLYSLFSNQNREVIFLWSFAGPALLFVFFIFAIVKHAALGSLKKSQYGKRFLTYFLCWLGLLFFVCFFLNSFIEIDIGIWVAQRGSGIWLFLSPLVFVPVFSIITVWPFLIRSLATRNRKVLRYYALFLIVIAVVLTATAAVMSAYGSLPLPANEDIQVPGQSLVDYEICSCFGKRVEIAPSNNTALIGKCYGIASCHEKDRGKVVGLQDPQVPSLASEIVANISGETAEPQGVVGISKQNALWQPIEIGSGIIFSSLYFVDGSTGFAIGLLNEKGIVYKTVDGGKNWSQLAIPEAAYLANVYFNDKDHGFISGIKPGLNGDLLLLSTADGGSTWKSASPSLEVFPPLGMSFPSRDLGYLISPRGKIAKFDAKTGALALLYSNENDIYGGIFFSSEKKGRVIAHSINPDSSLILSTKDGGKNWQRREVADFNLAHAFFISDDIFFISGRSGEILKTVDGGIHWLPINVPTGNAILSINFSSESEGMVVDSKGEIWETSNGGKSWLTSSPKIERSSEREGAVFNTIYSGGWTHTYALDNYGQLYKLVTK